MSMGGLLACEQVAWHPQTLQGAAAKPAVRSIRQEAGRQAISGSRDRQLGSVAAAAAAVF